MLLFKVFHATLYVNVNSMNTLAMSGCVLLVAPSLVASCLSLHIYQMLRASISKSGSPTHETRAKSVDVLEKLREARPLSLTFDNIAQVSSENDLRNRGAHEEAIA